MSFHFLYLDWFSLIKFYSILPVGLMLYLLPLGLSISWILLLLLWIFSFFYFSLVFARMEKIYHIYLLLSSLLHIIFLNPQVLTSSWHLLHTQYYLLTEWVPYGRVPLWRGRKKLWAYPGDEREQLDVVKGKNWHFRFWGNWAWVLILPLKNYVN